MIQYIYQEDKNRLVALDGDKEIGKITYSDGGDNWLVDHTGVDVEYRGRSIAGQLLDHLVEEARRQGKKIVPVCPYVVKKFEASNKYEDVKKK